MPRLDATYALPATQPRRKSNYTIRCNNFSARGFPRVMASPRIRLPFFLAPFTEIYYRKLVDNGVMKIDTHFSGADKNRADFWGKKKKGLKKLSLNLYEGIGISGEGAAGSKRTPLKYIGAFIRDFAVGPA